MSLKMGVLGKYHLQCRAHKSTNLATAGHEDDCVCVCACVFMHRYVLDRETGLGCGRMVAVHVVVGVKGA